MELSRLIEALSAASAYPFPAAGVVVCQTHISVVFLAGPFAYKVKKPVRFDFLDFSTLERRRHFCAEEVRLNRRLAPSVYLGVVPVVEQGEGLRVEGEGEAVEWAVKMRRLPESATLRERLRGGEVGAGLVEAVAARVAAFHRESPAPADKARLAGLAAVSKNLLDIYEESAGHVGTTVAAAVHNRLRGLTRAALARLGPLIEARAARGLTRDAHGDLHLRHVYHFPDEAPPGDLAIIDCIEFGERYRFIDPVADAAFLVMDLAFHGRRDLARSFADAYFRAAGDEEGRALLPLYTAYRATVRGLVEGLALGEEEVPESERRSLLCGARAHWLLALSELEEPVRRPCLVLACGLPGSGKSTLARSLAARAGFVLVRSDEVRKELAGLRPEETPSAEACETLYSAEWSDRTYAACLRRAEEKLFEGGRVLVDANFREERRRATFLEAAARWGVRSAVLICRADAEVAKARLDARRGDASDADSSVYQMLAARWEEPSPATRARTVEIDGQRAPEEVVEQGLEALRGMGLL